MSERTADTPRPDERELNVEASAADVPAGPGRSTDPVVRRLGLLALLLVVFWLSAMVTALFTGILSSDAPRTGVERALGMYVGEVAAGTMTAEKWADYVTVLTAAGQYSRAQQMIDTALAAVPGSASLILFEQSRLYVARGEYDAAITSAEETIKAAREELEAMRAEAAERGVPFTQERLEQEETAVLLIAEVHEATGDAPRAIEWYTTFLEYKPAAANVYVRRGNARADTGDVAGAGTDYREALRFVADEPAALAGLERIGVEEQ